MDAQPDDLNLHQLSTEVAELKKEVQELKNLFIGAKSVVAFVRALGWLAGIAAGIYEVLKGVGHHG